MYGRSVLINSSVESHRRCCVRAGGFEDENAHTYTHPHTESSLVFGHKWAMNRADPPAH